ncbi:hypothetical protein [Brevibacillus sp. NRS-1366]|uniref:hypothetical protein n=1 Tax=Brevibacillus sp. NRS-1366 TaxID=3233899 RepID=UPI003D1F0FAF
MTKEAYKILDPVCEKHGVDFSIVESHKCEAYCGDILEADADLFVNGWFYCYSCKENGYCIRDRCSSPNKKGSSLKNGIMKILQVCPFLQNFCSPIRFTVATRVSLLLVEEKRNYAKCS